jgi:hypothetical protein
VVTVAGQAVATRTGSITAGKFAGATAVSEVATPSINLLNCFGPPGITSASGYGTIAIVSL